MSDEILSELRGMRADMGEVRITMVRIEQEVITASKEGERRQKSIDDHETRIRVLEAFKWKLVGVGIAAGGVAGAVSALISRILDTVGG